MFWRSVQRWRGVVLVGLAGAATLVFALTGQLVLYIHPRYLVFTVAMVAVALVLVVLSAVVAGRGEEEEPSTRLSRVLGGVGVAIAGVLALTMIVLPPATLSSATADQRDINSTALGASTTTVEDAAAAGEAAFAEFTVLDWASLLRQTTDLDFYADKPVDVVGFITPHPSDPDVFYVSRFFVTCCAVDAQPAGVPVYAPGWSQSLSADDWVRVTGTFSANPSAASEHPIALLPEVIEPTDQPAEPYLF